MMTMEFEMPECDDGSDEGKLVAWHVEPGDTVQSGDRIADVETDKSVIEVTAPGGMVVTELLHEVGDDIPVGEPLVAYDEVDDAESESDESSADEGPVSAVSRVDDGSEDAESEADEGGEEPTSAVSHVEGESVAPDEADDATEVLIVGAGPGGYVAAIRAAQLGLDVTLVERDAYGGTCLNYGCIPSKALIHGSDVAHEARNAEDLGITADVEVDFAKLVDWKDNVVDQLTGGVENLCQAAGATLIEGTARFVDDHVAEVETDGGASTLAFENAIVATGSRVIEIPGFEPDGEYVLDSRDALDLDEIPDSLVVIGAGYIGMELSTVFAKLGTDVTVVEMLEDVLPMYEGDISRIVREEAADLGIEFRFGELAADWERDGDGVVVTTEDEDGATAELKADAVLAVPGREPITDTVGLGALGIEPDDDGFVPTDAQGRTARDHVFAIGDVAGEPMLAHKASHEGEVAAAAVAGEPAALDHRAMPAAVFTDPEVATVGLTEADAEEAGYTTAVGQMPLSGNGRALTVESPEGFVRIVADAPTGTVLGAQIVAPEASELIGEVALAVEQRLTLEELAGTVHTHPTLSEAIMEAAADAAGEAIHTH
ncbi:Pyruvate/2-oxoglutarate dehydrogenase complex, dihydrolipoamide acyltransferase (E2) component or related enzyme [Halapricum desulfuricans]|uniref:Dihydrolipoyl dehydrogenase n=1 Tax=Halapricum desulfuricans TaxID=2841257 RepID=A0A897N6N0_9EURY|nr:Pyruvate/2-oxoglutarate dehydrogenase complex, dihydrolipoamide acyltransferase (E2) component or related enzyme [Halapricum desulfuricans]